MAAVEDSMATRVVALAPMLVAVAPPSTVEQMQAD